MNPALCHAGSKIHKISLTLSKVIGDGGRGRGGGERHFASAFYSVKLCVMINFSFRHNVLCCACHREEQTCFWLLFVSVIHNTLNNFRILPFILDFISWSRYVFLGLDIYLTFTFILVGFAFKYSTKLILPDQDLSGSHIGFLCFEMAGNSNKNADIDSSFTFVPATQELFSSPEPDDIFLTVQHSTFAVGKIYNDLFANSRSDLISELSELCCVAELRYVRDMVFCIVKRKLGQSNLGSLIEGEVEPT